MHRVNKGWHLLINANFNVTYSFYCELCIQCSCRVIDNLTGLYYTKVTMFMLVSHKHYMPPLPDSLSTTKNIFRLILGSAFYVYYNSSTLKPLSAKITIHLTWHTWLKWHTIWKVVGSLQPFSPNTPKLNVCSS